MKSIAECKALKDFLKARGLKDVWKCVRGSDDGFTYFHRHGAARLDRFYTNKNTIDRVVSILNTQAAFTDHLGVILELKEVITTRNREPTRSLWKMNTSILKEEYFQENFKEFWNRISTQPSRSGDVTRWWERSFKPGLKRLTIRYCKQRAVERREKIESLNCRLTEITNRMVISQGNITKLEVGGLWERGGR